MNALLWLVHFLKRSWISRIVIAFWATLYALTLNPFTHALLHFGWMMTCLSAGMFVIIRAIWQAAEEMEKQDDD